MLRQIHDELDEAVLEAYGWQDLKEAPHSCGAGGCAAIEKREALPNDDPSAPRQECRGSSDALLIRLIRWLRPDYQNPTSATPHPVQTTLAGTEAPSSKSKIQNPKSKINNHQSTIPLPSPGPTACRSKSRSFASSSAPATEVSPLLTMLNRSPPYSAAKTKNAPNRSRES